MEQCNNNLSHQTLFGNWINNNDYSGHLIILAPSNCEKNSDFHLKDTLCDLYGGDSDVKL